MLAEYEWQDANRKRGREDEYEDIATGGTLGFTEHRSVGGLLLSSCAAEAPMANTCP